MIRRGQIRWYRFNKPDKRRPVVVLTRDAILEYLNEVTVAPLTTTVRDIPSEVTLTPADGVPETCAVNLDHIQTVPKARLGAMIAAVSQEKQRALDKAIAFALGFAATP